MDLNEDPKTFPHLFISLVFLSSFLSTSKVHINTIPLCLDVIKYVFTSAHVSFSSLIEYFEEEEKKHCSSTK